MTVETLEHWLHRLVDAVVSHPHERELLHQELERVGNPIPAAAPAEGEPHEAGFVGTPETPAASSTEEVG
jgi:hypothetical protein